MQWHLHAYSYVLNQYTFSDVHSTILIVNVNIFSVCEIHIFSYVAIGYVVADSVVI